MNNTAKKIVSVRTLKNKISQHRKKGRVIAFTNGCFDIIHYGHISYLQAAKKNNRILIIGLNSDVSIGIIKGKKRPIIKQDHRAKTLAALECVDYITIFDEDTPQKIIGQLKPDILIKGADWKGKKVAGSDEVKANGGKVEYIKYIDGLSTSKIINKIIKTCKS